MSESADDRLELLAIIVGLIDRGGSPVVCFTRPELEQARLNVLKMDREPNGDLRIQVGGPVITAGQ